MGDDECNEGSEDKKGKRRAFQKANAIITKDANLYSDESFHKQAKSEERKVKSVEKKTYPKDEGATSVLTKKQSKRKVDDKEIISLTWVSDVESDS